MVKKLDQVKKMTPGLLFLLENVENIHKQQMIITLSIFTFTYLCSRSWPFPPPT